MTKAPPYLRAGEVAELLGVHVRTVRRWIADGSLPSIKVGGTRVVDKSAMARRASSSPAMDLSAAYIVNDNYKK